MQSSTIKDDLAIARDWHSLVGTILLPKAMRIDTHRAANALMTSWITAAAV
jgi:hypothetical protein